MKIINAIQVDVKGWTGWFLFKITIIVFTLTAVLWTVCSSSSSKEGTCPNEIFVDSVFTDRVRSTMGGYVFSLSTPKGYPSPSPSHNTSTGSMSFLGVGYPSDWSQVRIGGTPWWGNPCQGCTPLARDGVHPGIEQQLEYLARCGQYASCVHAGGLSCLCVILRCDVFMTTTAGELAKTKPLFRREL